MKKVLFVCYGSGHVRMVVPVALALARQGLARVQVLALTTAFAVAREAGLDVLQFKDFLLPGDEAALAHGRRLLEGLGEVADPEETVAYLGLSYAELEAEVGTREAAARYRRDGRQAFLPLRTLERILRRVAPDLVVATNSPRAERAAVMGARHLGIPAVCMVDLFAVDEVKWMGAPDYGDRICVLNEPVRQFLITSGRGPEQVCVTGNPAFDVLLVARWVEEGAALRRAYHWEGKRVLLWPTQVEPAFHPFDGRAADSSLPARALAKLVDWVLGQEDAVLCVRPRAGESPPALPRHDRIVVTGQDWPLPPLLHAVDTVVTLNSTVSLEGYLAGARVIQILGSVFDRAMPLARFGIADGAVALDALEPELDRCTRLPRRPRCQDQAAATPRVVAVLREFL